MGLRIAVLGSLQVGVGDRELAPLTLGRRERALLTLFALHPGALVRTSRLVDELWPERPPQGAANTVQVYVSRLRRRLGADSVQTRPTGYALNVRSDDVDVVQFEQLAEQGTRALRSGHYGEAASVLRRALALWGGDPLVDGTELPSVQAEAVRLTELQLSILEDRIEADLALGRGPDLVAELTTLAEKHPFRERLQAALITALLHAGRQVEALERYGAYRTRCVDEIGIEPGSALQQLQGSILAGGADLAPVAAPPDRLSKTPDSEASVPRPVTPLVGRDGELAELTPLLTTAGVRLVTLTGPGGSGKTRLAVGAAQRLGQAFPDGVYFVPLAAVTTADVMWTSIAAVLNVPPEGRIPPGLFEHVAHRSALFVLDNLEQLHGADTVVAELLEAARQVVVLATSRRPLNIPGEYQHAVPPLQLPEGEALPDAQRSGAVQLFVQHAQAVNSTFALSAENAADAAAICRRLDGLPLAIELVAARSKILTPRALLARLDEALDIRAAGGQRPSRQQTLRATMTWSYDLLTPHERAFFRRLGVFAGGADLDAIAAVAGDLLNGTDPLNLIGELVDASLIAVTARPDGEPRIHLLETVRAYSLDQLRAAGELDTTQRLHAHHYLDVARALRGSRGSSQHLATRHQLETELDNLRAALAWTLDPHAEPASDRVAVGQQLCIEVRWLWLRGGYLAEGQRWLERCTSLADGHPDPRQAANLSNLSHLVGLQGDVERSRAIADAALKMARGLHDDELVVDALTDLATAHTDRGEFRTARQFLQEALTLARKGTDRRRLRDVLFALSNLEPEDGPFDTALLLVEEMIALGRELDDLVLVTMDEHNKAYTLAQMGRPAEAAALFRDLIDDAVALHYPEFTVSFAESFAEALAELGDGEHAAQLLGAAMAMRERIGMPLSPRWRHLHAKIGVMAERQMLPMQWNRAYAAGRSQTVEAALTHTKQA